MSNLATAISLAALGHEGQTRNDEETPYIVHPLRVMLKALTYSNNHAIVAILHDTIEDTDLTIGDLKNEGFSKEVILAVGLLTRTLDTSYDNYLAAIKNNDLARTVKILDIEDNLADDPSPKQVIRYTKALEFLRS